MRSRVTNVFLVGVVLSAASVGGCGSSDREPQTGSSIALELEVAPGVALSQLTYSITNPALLPAPRTDTIEFAHSQTIRFVVGGLPVGDGYTIALMGTTDGANPLTCAGTATFQVLEGITNSVDIALVCGAPLPGGQNGTIVVNASATLQAGCAALTSLSASPSEANVGATMALTGTGIDAAGATSDVTFTWSLGGAPIGTLSNASGNSTTFTCTGGGTQTVLLSAAVAGNQACPGAAQSITVRCDSACSWGLTPAATAVTGLSPTSVVVGDWNGDGKADLAVGNSNLGRLAGTVGILLGAGDGTFRRQVAYPSGGLGVSALASADFDGDGKTDIVVANASSNNVCVLAGRGDGTFGAPVVHPTGALPSGLAVADLNGDHTPDLIVADLGSDPIGPEVLLGAAGGPLLAPVSYPADVGGSNAVAAGDLNGDGKTDLVVANDGTANVSVLLGNGDGSFGPFVTYMVGSMPWSVAIGDLNGDGKLDLAVADEGFGGPGEVSVLLGNGDGTFQPQVQFGVGSLPWFVSIADMNGDSKPDLVVADNGSDDVGVLLGNGDGTFQPEVTFATGSYPAAVAIGDWNGDGRPDLAVVNQGGTGNATVLLGTCTP